ncbi:DUF3772 domain-containing protein [Pendulispora rubella]|uniref:DUF3772 domain-containing protein n=1 Tax=Pendulispora rubella TaxID=2741070 RepID=A0ABZ2KQW1_9BACT
MSKPLLRIVLSAVCFWLSAIATAPVALAAPPAAVSTSASAGSNGPPVPTLKELQAQEDRLKQQVSTATGRKQLDDLVDDIQGLGANVDKLNEKLAPERAQVQDQLDVLGPPPRAGEEPEAQAIADQRASLIAQGARLDDELKQAAGTKEGLANLTQQIAKMRRTLMRNQLVLQSGSILGPTFWAPLFKLEPADELRLHGFSDEVAAQWQSVWRKGQRGLTSFLLLAALALWLLGGRLLERGLAWVCLHRIPEGRLRRSLLAFATAFASVLATALAMQLAYFAVARAQPFTPILEEFADELVKVAITCAMIAGLGRALLCTERPSWRLSAMADPVARALKPFPRILAGLLMVSGALEQLNRAVDTSVPVTVFGRGLVALVVVLTIGASLLRANRVRGALAAAGEAPEARSTLTGLVHAGVTLTVTIAFAALLIGYIAIARFLTYELVWFDIVLCTYYLLTKLSQDIFESLFSAQNSSGKTIKHLFGLDDSHLAQASTVLSGVSTSLLLLLAVLALLQGGVGATPAILVNSIVSAFGNDQLNKMNIAPSHIVNAIIALSVGIYLLRAVRKWFDDDLLPKTGMDLGLRASLVTLFSNIGYVVIVLVTLAILGVKWDNLTWIVSALSVGIGFGLQEIVKNFVSGIILLTERPVKVGDMVSISGVEGDIRRINVRATEIQLGDRSIVIVPNSQLISQNLRNVTMGNRSQGVATLMLTFPLDSDPEQLRDLLLDAYRQHPAILEAPAPSVTFSQLTHDGITLSVTGYVASPRITANTKSDLLFEILKRLRAANISLSNPQMLMVQNQPPAQS